LAKFSLFELKKEILSLFMLKKEILSLFMLKKEILSLFMLKKEILSLKRKILQKICQQFGPLSFYGILIFYAWNCRQIFFLNILFT